MKEGQRSLYQCRNAKITGGRMFGDTNWQSLYCAKGYNPLTINDRPLDYFDVQEGDPLYCDTCKDCRDFSDNGDKIYYKGDRGWT